MSENKCSYCLDPTENIVKFYTIDNWSNRAVINEGYICEDCRDENFCKCYGCERLYDTDNLEEFACEEYCRLCLDQDTRFCDSCDTRFWADEIYDGYCRSCQEDREEDEDYCGLIHPYDYKPEPVYFGGAGIIKYGVELEVTCKGVRLEEFCEDVLSLLGDNHVYLKSDGSVDYPGVEIVTHPHTLKAHKELWTPKFFELPLVFTRSNGMHVHIQRSGLRSRGSSIKSSKPVIAKMLQFINDPDNKSLITQIAGRDYSSYARYNSEIKATRINHGTDKYSALNISPERTVELRVFQSPTTFDKFMSNLEFCDCLVSFCKYHGIGGMNASNFLRFVKKCRTLYKFLYKELITLGIIERTNAAAR